MHNIALKSVIICLTTILLQISAKAQEESDTSFVNKTILLEDVVVTAQRTPVQAFRSGRIVRVITKEEIQSLPSQSIDYILEYILNIDSRQRGANGVQSDISIRGGSFDQTLVLLNGINISDPQTGHHNMNLPVDVDDILRIEILEGPASRSFGANAFGGVINIITGGKENTLKVHGSLSAGDFGFFKAGINVTIPAGRTLHYISATCHLSEGYTDNTDYNITNFYYNNRINTGFGQIDFHAGLANRAFGANSFYSPKYPDQYEQIHTFFTSLQLNKNIGAFRIAPYIYWRRNQDQFALFRNNPPSWYENDNYHLTSVNGGGVNFYSVFLSGTVSAGADVRYEKILSNVLGEILSHPVRIPWEDSIYFTKGHSRLHAGAFLEYSLTIKQFYVSGGMMLAYNSDNTGKLTPFPGIDIGCQISKKIRWFISVNRALRIPTFTDLYYFSPIHQGNPNLLPEKAITFENGLKFKQNDIDGYISYFHRRGSDIIDWVKYPSDNVWVSMNHTKVNTSGLGFFIRWMPANKSNKGMSIKSVQFGYGYLDSDKDSGEMQSKYALDPLSHKIDFFINHNLIKNISIILRLSYQDRKGNYQPFKDQQYLEQKPYPPVLLTDGKIYREYRSGIIYAQVTNILNISYFDNANVPQPGRWYKAGISFNICNNKNVNRKAENSLPLR